MYDSQLIDRMDHDAATADDDHTQLGLLLVSTVVFGLCGGLFVLWSAGTMLWAFLAYMAGGWFGIAFAALTIMGRNGPV